MANDHSAATVTLDDTMGSAMRRIGRELRLLLSQKAARDNAAEASAELRGRRHEREEVAAYLDALDPPTEAFPRCGPDPRPRR